MIFKYLYKIFVLSAITVYYSILVILLMRFKPNNEHFFRYIRSWAKTMIRSAAVDVKTIGLEHISDGKAYIFCSNHSSLFDIPVLFSILPNYVSIIYKKELQKVPFFGYGMKSSPFVAIDRSHARSALDSLKQATKLLKDGFSMIIYPEGTRSKNGRLQLFKRGAFLLAAMSEADTVPVAILGTNSIMPQGKKSFNACTVEVHISKPIALEGRTGKQAESFLQERVRAEMLKYLQEN